MRQPSRRTKKARILRHTSQVKRSGFWPSANARNTRCSDFQKRLLTVLRSIVERNPMIVEFRTYRLKPGTVAQAEENFGKALPARTKLSPLAALWHTEIGPL